MRVLRYLLIISLASYLLLEAALWIFLPVPNVEEKKIDLRQHLPGLQEHVVYTSNRFGFRSLSMKTREKPASVIRIFAIGASTTDQINQNTPDLWSAILETMLNEKFADSGVKFEVAAWGRGGEKIFDRVRFMREELPKYEPDIVLTLEGINDMAWNGGAGYEYSGPQSRMKGTNNKKKWYEWVKQANHKYSQTYKRFKLFQSIREERKNIKEGKVIEYTTDSLSRNHKHYTELPYRESLRREPDPLAEFRDGLEELAGESTRQGLELILLTQPVLWKAGMTDTEKEALWFFINTPEGQMRVDPVWLEGEMNRYNEAQIAVARKRGLSWVSLHETLPKKQEYFFDDCHFTDRGNRAVAEAVFPVLEERVRKVLDGKTKQYSSSH